MAEEVESGDVNLVSSGDELPRLPKHARGIIDVSSDGDLSDAASWSSVDAANQGRLAVPGGASMYSLWFRCSRGSAEYHRLCRRAGFPPGPMTPSECANWPVTNAASLISFDRDGSMVNRVSQLLRYGMVVHTDYSGKQSPEVMLRMWARGLAKHGVSIPLAKIRFFRACDKSQLCLKVIADGKACPDHAFCGVLERLPLHHQKELRARRPHGHPKRSLASRACRQAAYDSQREYLQEHAASLFTWNSCAPVGACVLHPHSSCPISLAGAEAQVCIADDDVDDDDDDNAFPPLTHVFAGTMCTPWSSFGKREGVADPATEPYWIWETEQATLQPDMVSIENSPFFPLSDLLGGRLAQTHTMVAMVVGSEDFVYVCIYMYVYIHISRLG